VSEVMNMVVMQRF